MIYTSIFSSYKMITCHSITLCNGDLAWIKNIYIYINSQKRQRARQLQSYYLRALDPRVWTFFISLPRRQIVQTPELSRKMTSKPEAKATPSIRQTRKGISLVQSSSEFVCSTLGKDLPRSTHGPCSNSQPNAKGLTGLRNLQEAAAAIGMFPCSHGLCGP